VLAEVLLVVVSELDDVIEEELEVVMDAVVEELAQFPPGTLKI